mgnify:FL=1
MSAAAKLNENKTVSMTLSNRSIMVFRFMVSNLVYTAALRCNYFDLLHKAGGAEGKLKAFNALAT